MVKKNSVVPVVVLLLCITGFLTGCAKNRTEATLESKSTTGEVPSRYASTTAVTIPESLMPFIGRFNCNQGSIVVEPGRFLFQISDATPVEGTWTIVGVNDLVVRLNGEEEEMRGSISVSDTDASGDEIDTATITGIDLGLAFERSNLVIEDGVLTKEPSDEEDLVAIKSTGSEPGDSAYMEFNDETWGCTREL